MASMVNTIGNMNKKNEGILLFRYGIKRILNFFFGMKTSCVFEKDLLKPINKYRPKVILEYKLASFEELEKMRNEEYGFKDNDYSAAKQWILDNDLCLIGYVDRKIATYLWVNYRFR